MSASAPGGGPMDRPAGWPELASYLAALSVEERASFSRYAGLGLPDESEDVEAALLAYAAQNPGANPSGLLATTGAQAGLAGDLGLARRLGAAALDLADTPEERQLAHVCLAQTHFRNRREEADLAGFVEHCRAAVDLGHAGTFCYERLATLYEYRGELEAAMWVCRRAVEVLGAEDPGSAEIFRRRLRRLADKV
jgi:hypothetical protein